MSSSPYGTDDAEWGEKFVVGGRCWNLVESSMYIKLRKKPFRGEPKLRKSKLFESMIRTYEPPSFTTFFFIENLDQFRLFACSGYVEVRKGFKYSTPALSKTASQSQN